MKLIKEELLPYIIGSCNYQIDNDGITPLRFQDRELEYYKGTDHKDKSYASSGIRLSFQSNAKTIRLKMKMSEGSTRTWYTISCFVDGILFKRQDNHDGKMVESSKLKDPFPLGDVELEISLDGDNHTIEIYLPFSTKTTIKEVELLSDEEVKIIPIKRKEKMLILGDSITQGYDASSPELSYSSIISNALGYEAINKGIAGEYFQSEFAKSLVKDDFKLITVSYGSNDWRYGKKERFETEPKKFFENLKKVFPNVEIYALLPINRVHMLDVNEIGSFEESRTILKRILDEIKGIHIIDMRQSVPENSEYYSDIVLHPNDSGFQFMADTFLKEYKKSKEENNGK